MNDFSELFAKSKALIENARSSMGIVVNVVTVYTSFLLGKYMIEEEQQGEERAKYGEKVLDSLSSYLTKEYGRGFSRSNLAAMRKFYLTYRDRETAIVQSGIGQLTIDYQEFPFKLSWTHYQVLMTIGNQDERCK